MLIRSILFYVCLTMWTILMGITCVPYLFASNVHMQKPVKLWIFGIFSLLKHLCKITYEIKGRENIPDYPLIIASQTIPIIVIAPMLLVWVGYGLMPKIIVVALISFFPIVVNTVDGMKSIDNDLERLFKTMGATRWDIFRKIRIPNSLPYMFSGLRISISISVIGAVIGEWVGSSEGLGYLMIRSKPQFQTELVFAAIFILSIMGILLFFGIGLLEKISIPWNRYQKGDSFGK